MGPTWLNLTPTGVYVRKFLVSHKERILQSMSINEDLPYKERYSPPRNKGQFYVTIKTPNPSQIKVCIIYLSSGTLELQKFSKLTFEGYLASATPVLSIRSSFSLLSRCCLEHMRTMQLTDDFWHHQLALSMGRETTVVEAILLLLGQRVVWYSLARWLPPIITKETNHVPLPSRDRFRLSLRP